MYIEVKKQYHKDKAEIGKINADISYNILFYHSEYYSSYS